MLLNPFLLLLISVGPGLAWVWYFSRQDPEREPGFMLLRTFFTGALAVLPAALLEIPLRPALAETQTVTAAAFLALLAIGFIEEGAKCAAAYRAAYN